MWNELTHFAGLDWSKNQHQIVVVDNDGRIVAEFAFAHEADAWRQARQRLREFPAVAVAIETSQGAAVEKLLEAELTVYPVNPKSARRYRERHAPSGNKTDRIDAWSLADALRLDGAAWRPLAPEDPLIQQLRLLCRDEVTLIAQRTALINQLQQALYEYYPAAREAFEDWTLPSAWAFVERFPTPHTLAQAGQRQWQKFLHLHHLWRPATSEKRLEAFAHAEQFAGSPAVTAAKSLLALTLVKMLRVLEQQLADYRARIQQLFEQHPDHDLFGSLPGAGQKLAPRLMSELGSNRDRFPEADNLACYAGTAPVQYQSGSVRVARMRRACNKHLRYAVHLWADLSRAQCPWAQAYYQAHRAKGNSHAAALRCLGKRWLKILWAIWQTRRPYNADLHTRNQTEHGSWLLQLQAS